jgi:hypothetical protein
VTALVLIARSGAGPGKESDRVVSAISIAQKGSLPPEAVLAIAPRSDAKAQARTASAAAISPLLRDYINAKEVKPIYERLSKIEHPTGEEQWMLASILQSCARVAEDEPDRVKRGKIGDAGARDRFLAALPPNDPVREQRIAAFDQVNYDRCGDLAKLDVTRKQIRDLYEAGAAHGDPKARVALVQQSISDQQRGPDGKWRYDQTKPATIDDAQLQILKDAVSSGDLYAMRGAFSLLSGSQYGNFSLRTADDTPLDRTALWMASSLVGCDYGARCGPDSEWLLHSCAMQGQCAARNTRDFVMYYIASPSTSQAMSQYEAAIRNAATNRDWSFFRFHSGPAPGTAIYQAPQSP